MKRGRIPFPPYVSAVLPFLVFLFGLASALSFAFQGDILQGKVMQVKDGDTVVVAPADGGEFYTCRLYGIDAPEKRQPYGAEATKELKRLVLGQTVVVELTGSKTYGRHVCIIRKDNRIVNLEMVSRGYAWAYRQYLKRPYASEYIDAEKSARDKRLGLWQDLNPTPPWEFRKLQRNPKGSNRFFLIRGILRYGLA